eukprot:scaffold46542_cov17-Tisochrysis_lutea.AAC.1
MTIAEAAVPPKSSSYHLRPSDHSQTSLFPSPYLILFTITLLHTCAGRALALQLARIGRVWKGEAAKKMPVARGDIREIVDAPVFIP